MDSHSTTAFLRDPILNTFAAGFADHTPDAICRCSTLGDLFIALEYIQ